MTIRSVIRIAAGMGILLVVAGLAAANPSVKPKTKSPRPSVQSLRPEIPAANASVVAALRQAKRTGDSAAAVRLQEQLGWPTETVAAPASTTRFVVRPERAAGAAKWGGDVLVNSPQWSSGYPAMTCAGDGTYYVVVVDLTNENYLDIYSSDDGGASWNYEVSVQELGAKIYHPSLAIGEGTYNRLLFAYEAGRNTAAAKVVVAWWDLDSLDADAVDVAVHPNNIIGHPRICVDSPEYSVWYAYLTYVKGTTGLGNYDLYYTRTLDYGVSWQTPTMLAGPLHFEGDHDLDFGASGLFIAWSVAAGSGDLVASWSTNFGAVFTSPLVLSAESRSEFEPSVAVANTGPTVVVSYAADYGGSDTDIETWTSPDGGASWEWVYLPFNDQPELGTDLTYDLAADAIQAAFNRGWSVMTAATAATTPTLWSPLRRVNEQQAVVPFARCAIAADPTGAYGVGVAWMDSRDPEQYGVYFNSEYATLPVAVEYLMLCPDALVDAAAGLARYRELRGYGVHLVPLSQIGPPPLSAVEIDQFIEDYALAAPQLRFLALVGDVGLLPGFLVDDGTEQWYSDLRYADTDGNFAQDYRPDVALGRIPVATADELFDYVAKVKWFEQTFRHRNKALFFGDQAEMSYVANRDSLAASDAGYVVETLYEPGETELMAALNDPSLALVLYYGHGSFANNWPLHIGNLDSWTSPGGPVLYFSGGCNFNDNVITGPPLGHQMLFAPGGAASATGATVYGGYGAGYLYIDALLDDIWYYPTLGELHRHALLEHYDAAAALGQDVSLGSWVQLFTGRMLCHGDPALRIDGDVTPVRNDTPAVQSLAQNYPNPFNPRTTIRFELKGASPVELRVYDLEGRLVRTLLERAMRTAGPHEVIWDGRDQRGADAPSGVYMYRLVSKVGAEAGKMVLVR